MIDTSTVKIQISYNGFNTFKLDFVVLGVLSDLVAATMICMKFYDAKKNYNE